ncbi:MAG: hypothetical protein RLZZ383_2218 [Pseudomonadota bacterium]|jgi:hypothetical protein
MRRHAHGARGVAGWALIGALACQREVGPDDVPADTPTDTDVGPQPDDTPDDTPRDTPADTVVPGETADTVAPVAAPDLSGVAFLPEPALAGCAVATFGSQRATAVLSAVGDLDGDGVEELVLANAVCPGPVGDIVHPVFAWDAAVDGLRLVNGLGDRLDAPSAAVGALTLVDFDEDGDADLIAAWRDPRRSNQTVMLQANLGNGTFEPRTWSADAAAPVTAGIYGFGLGWDGDDGVTIWSATRAADLGPADPHHVGRLRRRGGAWQLDATWGAQRPDLPGAWAWVPMSRSPNVTPVEHLFASVNHVPGDDDYHLGVADGVWEPATFVHRELDGTGRPVNALHFSTPACTDDTPVCFTPMGGTMVRFAASDASGADVARDCVLIAAGGSTPVYVQCPDPSGGWVEDGALGAAFSVALPAGPGGSPPPPRSSWQVSGTWDVNADGWVDVVVTTGRDFDVRPVSPSYAFLHTPACRGVGCARFAMAELPWPAGHVLGAVHLVVPRADGSWAVLVVPSLNAVYDDGVDAPRALRWSLPAGRHWLAVRVGSGHDLRGLGSIVRPHVEDAAGLPLATSAEVLLMSAPTWGMPGANPPLLLGIPASAASVSLEVDLPGCRPTVTVTTSVWDQPIDVPVAPCP